MAERVLVTGDREWTGLKLLREVLGALPEGSSIIHGGAAGADLMAGSIANGLGIKARTYPAYWNCTAYEATTGSSCRLADGRHRAVHGRPAGVIRNQRMLDEGNSTQVYAFHDHLEDSKGTKDMIERSLKAGLKVVHFSHEHPDGVVL